MDKINLNWSILPACIFGHLLSFKGKDSFYGPIFGTGVYLFIFPTKKGYQIYYIGESTEVGSRLMRHFTEYTSVRSDYYIVTDIALFEEDIYQLYLLASSEYMQQESEGFPIKERQVIGQTLMHNTYFAFALVESADKAKLRNVEALLQIGLLEKNGLPKHGWLGEKTSIVPSYKMEVHNLYPTEIVQKMIKPTLPSIIQCEEGGITYFN